MNTATMIISLCSALGIGGILLFFVKRYFSRRDTRENDRNADLKTIVNKITKLEDDFSELKKNYDAVNERLTNIDTCMGTIKLLAYSRLSDEIDRLLNKGFATPIERHYLQKMHENYKEHNWNGDMDARLERVWALPENPSSVEREAG